MESVDAVKVFFQVRVAARFAGAVAVCRVNGVQAAAASCEDGSAPFQWIAFKAPRRIERSQAGRTHSLTGRATGNAPIFTPPMPRPRHGLDGSRCRKSLFGRLPSSARGPSAEVSSVLANNGSSIPRFHVLFFRSPWASLWGVGPAAMLLRKMCCGVPPFQKPKL